MSTFTQIYYHIVFSTKDRMPALSADKRENLFRYDTSKASRTITRSSLSETNCVGCWSNSGFDSMKNTWFEPLRDYSTLSGSIDGLTNFRGLHSRLFALFAFGERGGILAASPQCFAACRPAFIFPFCIPA